MLKIISDAKRVGALYKKRAALIANALRRGLLKSAAAVDEKQVDYLAGSNSAAPGAYPVPNRTGHLMGAHFFKVHGSDFAIVGNSARYAVSIHEGLYSSAVYGRRPFLDDAVKDTDVAHIMAGELRSTIFSL